MYQLTKFLFERGGKTQPGEARMLDSQSPVFYQKKRSACRDADLTRTNEISQKGNPEGTQNDWEKPEEVYCGRKKRRGLRGHSMIERTADRRLVKEHEDSEDVFKFGHKEIRGKILGRLHTSIVGSYSSTKWFWISWMVNALFPTPPAPTTTSLYSVISAGYWGELSKEGENRINLPDNIAVDLNTMDDQVRHHFKGIFLKHMLFNSLTDCNAHSPHRKLFDCRIKKPDFKTK